MRVIICGSRSWSDPWLIKDRLARLPEGTVLVHGGSPGAERTAVDVSWQLKLRSEQRLPDWEAHGVGAGKIRNRQVALLGADLCLAFFDGGSDRDLANMIDEASRAGIPTEVVTAADVQDVVFAGDIRSMIARGFRLHE
jgi:hypothetical protein